LISASCRRAIHSEDLQASAAGRENVEQKQCLWCVSHSRTHGSEARDARALFDNGAAFREDLAFDCERSREFESCERIEIPFNVETLGSSWVLD
jgi:hypothetical protein